MVTKADKTVKKQNETVRSSVSIFYNGAYIPKVFDDSGEQGMMLTVQLESQTRSWFSSGFEFGYQKMKYFSDGLGFGLKPCCI